MNFINCKVVADKIKNQVKEEIHALQIEPKLGVILVGEDPASKIYVNNKRKLAEELGIQCELHEFSQNISEHDLLYAVHSLSRNYLLDGMIVQLPLPPHINKFKVLNQVPPERDVDCFTHINVGKIAQGNAVLKPCTPQAIIEILLHHHLIEPGSSITIINRSNVVGQPLSIILSQEPYNATVTVCHEYTKNLRFYTKNADVVVTAVGKEGFSLSQEDFGEKTVIIDVAIKRKGNKIYGDVEEGVKNLRTKVPGGVGLVTPVILMRNTLLAYKTRKKL